MDLHLYVYNRHKITIMTVILYYSIAGNIEDTAHNGWCLISNTYNEGSNVVMSGFGNGKTERNVLQKKHKEWGMEGSCTNGGGCSSSCDSHSVSNSTNLGPGTGIRDVGPMPASVMTCEPHAPKISKAGWRTFDVIFFQDPSNALIRAYPLNSSPFSALANLYPSQSHSFHFVPDSP